ncbi:pentapeptide repeat-containing protein [Amycolatopsis kentuckyensis]|uniref:pentapeptide repeat-containing protein n=1 Tax=Amycolatopsis kentuckyensis TaxID=218823 RepID=UPI000A3CFFDE|nr:pentapeptide repeat-containing protein [Amycolatopsis kentuckyensis]
MTDETTPPRASQSPESPFPATPLRVTRLRVLSPKAMWLTAAAITMLTAIAVVVLWWPATAGLNGAELVKARQEALKIGLSIGVGSGGVVALYLAWRRQRSTEADLDNRERALAHQQEVAAATMAHQDRVARATEHDAAERRLTELYLKAVEQLGSTQAAVRHGGLYALERVAQDNFSQRQTVADVICAYLRSPYELPAAGIADDVPHELRDEQRERIQEREVRLTAQRILHRHLQPGDESDQPHGTFWADIELDFTGATLIDFTLIGCRVGKTSFRETTFIGGTWFDRAAFTSDASFTGAAFDGEVSCSRATFTGGAWFDRATFTDQAWFEKANFASGASFNGATFTNEVTFSGAAFTSATWFTDANFNGHSSFNDASFEDDVIFTGVNFIGNTSFNGTRFRNGAAFNDVTFNSNASFTKTNFDSSPNFTGATKQNRRFNAVRIEKEFSE